MIKKTLLAVSLSLAASTASAAFWDDAIDWVKDTAEDAVDTFSDIGEDVIDFFGSAEKVLGQAGALVVSSITNIVDGRDLSPDPKITEFQQSWTWKALKHQRRLEQHTPLSQSSMMGSHNTYNSKEYTDADSYLDPQHEHTIYDQLRLGISFIELDAHWTAHAHGDPTDWGKDILLCHSGIGASIGDWHVGCGLTDRKYRWGLQEVRNWLADPKNGDEVIILYIEDHTDGHHSNLYSDLIGSIGPSIYQSEGCKAIPDSLSKADVLNAGKQVIVRIDSDCSSNSGIANMTFTEMGEISRKWEDATGVSAIIGATGADVTADITPADIRQYQKEGKNLINLDSLTYDDGHLDAAVWSWDRNEPNNHAGVQNCAVQWSNGRWDDAQCDRTYFFACENTQNGSWSLSTYQGQWSEGHEACAALGDNYEFSVPTNSPANEALKAEKGGQTHVWLNYNDQNQEGYWVGKQKPVVLSFRMIRNVRTGSCIDLPEAKNGKSLSIKRCYGNPHQRWQYANGFFVSALGKCMDNRGKTYDSDAKIGVWDCVDHDNLRFDWVGKTIRSRHDSNIAIDAWGSGHHGLSINQNVANPGSRDQQFVWSEYRDIADEHNTDTYRNIVGKRDTLCMVVKDGVISNQQNVVLGECTNEGHALWRYDTQKKRFHLKANDNYCLAHGDASDAKNYGKVVINTCVDDNHHRWALDGRKIRNVYNQNYVIDSSDDHLGADVIQYWHHGGENQQWRWLNF